jgi:uncharacterized OsmC-like protein
MGKMVVKPVGKLTYKAVVGEHTIIASESESMGGSNAGPTPGQYLIASIGTCTAMYADLFCARNNLSIEGFEMELDYTQDEKTTQVRSLSIKAKYPKALSWTHKPLFTKFLDRCAVKSAIKEGFPIEMDYSDA